MSHPLFNLFYFFKGRSSQNDLSKLNKVSTGTVAALTVRVVVSWYLSCRKIVPQIPD